jgi:hypothetical protein
MLLLAARLPACLGAWFFASLTQRLRTPHFTIIAQRSDASFGTLIRHKTAMLRWLCCAVSSFSISACHCAGCSLYFSIGLRVSRALDSGSIIIGAQVLPLPPRFGRVVHAYLRVMFILVSRVCARVAADYTWALASTCRRANGRKRVYHCPAEDGLC